MGAITLQGSRLLLVQSSHVVGRGKTDEQRLPKRLNTSHDDFLFAAIREQSFIATLCR